MTYLWIPGLPIHVECDLLQTPQAFIWHGQRHPVQLVANRWRLDEIWWQQPVRRECFKIATDTGLLVVLYLDWSNGQWYLERLWD